MLCMIAFYIAPGSEATSCRAAIRTAKGVVSDIGERVAKKSPGLPELAKCSETHSERDVHRVIAKKYKLTLPIQMTELPKAPGMMYSGAIKVLSLKAWMQFIVDYNVWHMLCGLWKADAARERDILVEFWRRYRALKPHHAIWNLADQNKIDLSRCCPLMLHGGRRKRKEENGLPGHVLLLLHGVRNEAGQRGENSPALPPVSSQLWGQHLPTPFGNQCAAKDAQGWMRLAFNFGPCGKWCLRYAASRSQRFSGQRLHCLCPTDRGGLAVAGEGGAVVPVLQQLPEAAVDSQFHPKRDMPQMPGWTARCTLGVLQSRRIPVVVGHAECRGPFLWEPSFEPHPLHSKWKGRLLHIWSLSFLPLGGCQVAGSRLPCNGKRVHVEW